METTEPGLKEAYLMAEALRKDEHYNYTDYYSWDDGKRWELIDGNIYAMSPAPSMSHQSISMSIANQLYNYLRGKPSKVFVAPFDVRLNPGDKDDTVVQPDLVIVCDKNKLDDRGCKGVPEMVIEILSPSTSRHDRLVKFQLYQRFGVLEYWIVDPETKTVQANILSEGRYYASVYGDADDIPVHILENFKINLPDVFE